MVGLVQIKQSSDFFFVILQYLDTDVSKNIDTKYVSTTFTQMRYQTCGIIS